MSPIHITASLPPRRRRLATPWLGVWSLVALLACAGPLAAQDPQADLNTLSMEELAKLKVDAVNGASTFLQKADDAATSTTVVTGEAIQKYGYRTLADVLRSVRGFYAVNDRNYSYIGVRGLSFPGDYNARILFLLDGHRLNENIFDGAYVGTGFPVDVALIERIEVIRGPHSSLYGTGAFVAVVNVITKRGRDLDGMELSANAGSREAYNGRVSYGARFDNGLETFLSGSVLNSHGHTRLYYPEFDSPATNSGIAQDADGNQAQSVFADIIYRDLNIHVVQSSVTKHIPTASFGTVFNDARTRTTDARSYIDAQYHRGFGAWDVLGRVSYDRYDYHGHYVYDYEGTGTGPYVENYDAANGSWWDAQADATRTFFARHKVSLGAEYRRDIRQQQVNYDIEPYLLYLDDRRSAEVWSVYVQDRYAIHKNVALVAGVRSDWRRKYGNTLSPRVGLQLTPRPRTDITLHYGRAFRAPNSYEGFYAAPTASGGASLAPERIGSWEADVEHRFATTYYVSGAVFMNRVDDLIAPGAELVTTGADAVDRDPVYTNAAPLRTRGLELEVGSRWPGGQEASASYSLQDSRDITSGEVLPHSPRHLAKGNLSVPLRAPTLFASVDTQYMSARRTLAGTEVDGYVVMNVTVFARRLGKTLDLSGGIYNLWNTRYVDPGVMEHVQAVIPQDGRSLRLSLTYRPWGAR